MRASQVVAGAWPKFNRIVLSIGETGGRSHDREFVGINWQMAGSDNDEFQSTGKN